MSLNKTASPCKGQDRPAFRRGDALRCRQHRRLVGVGRRRGGHRQPVRKDHRGGRGKALITVITEDGEFTDECLVTVTASGSSGSGGGVEEVSLNKERLDLAIGDSYTLKATIGLQRLGKGVTWDTTNSSVATVSSSGVVKAKRSTCGSSPPPQMGMWKPTA